MTIVQGVIYIVSGNNSVGIVSTNLSNWIFTNEFLSIPLEFYYGLAIFLVVWYVLSFTPIGQKALVIGQSREVARLSGVRVNRQRSWAFILGAAIAGIAGIAYAATNGTVDPTAGSALILPAYAAVFLGATAIKPGRINALGALIAVYFLATGTAGLELLGAQSYYPADLLRRRAGRGGHDPEGEPRPLLQEAAEPPDERRRRPVRRPRPGRAGHRGSVRPRLRVRVDPGGRGATVVIADWNGERLEKALSRRSSAARPAVAGVSRCDVSRRARRSARAVDCDRRPRRRQHASTSSSPTRASPAAARRCCPRAGSTTWT